MSIRYALLGLLRDDPATGYDLTQRFAQGIGRHAWSAKHSQIYPELRKLTDEGLIEVIEEGARGKRVYDLTDAGRAELRRWLLAGPPAGTIRNPLLLWMFLIGGLDPEDAMPVLREVEKHAADMYDELTDVYAARVADGDELPTGAYSAQFGLFSYRAMRDWAQWAIEQQHKRSA